MSIAQKPPQNQDTTPQPPGPVPTLPASACPYCGCCGTPTVTRGTGPHAFRAHCSECGRFLRWVSRYSPAERMARKHHALRQSWLHRPPTGPQLAYLKALGDSGPFPANMAEASDRIARFEERKRALTTWADVAQQWEVKL
jgi:hypothetical protein